MWPCSSYCSRMLMPGPWAEFVKPSQTSPSGLSYHLTSVCSWGRACPEQPKPDPPEGQQQTPQVSPLAFSEEISTLAHPSFPGQRGWGRQVEQLKGHQPFIGKTCCFYWLDVLVHFRRKDQTNPVFRACQHPGYRSLRSQLPLEASISSSVKWWVQLQSSILKPSLSPLSWDLSHLTFNFNNIVRW